MNLAKGSKQKCTISGLVLVTALALVQVPAFAGIPDSEREAGINAALKIVDGINSKAAGLGPAFDQKSNPVYDKAELVINFNSRGILRRMKDGFLTLHSAGTTEGDSDPEMRLKIESALSGAKITREFSTGNGKHIVPKYAYVVFPGVADQLTHFGKYGDVFVVLKPGVKKRATWTSGDSFDFEDLIGKKMSNIDLMKRGVFGTFKYGQAEPKQTGRYFESQVWGPIDEKSIAEVVFPRIFAPESFMYPYMKQIFKEIIGAGIAISYYEEALSPAGEMNQIEPFLKRTKLKVGEYPTQIQVLSPEESRKRMIEIYDYDPYENIDWDQRKVEDQAQANRLIIPYLNSSNLP